MPSVVRKQDDEAPSHETISCEPGEVVNSTAERFLANSVVDVSHCSAEDVSSHEVDSCSDVRSENQDPTDVSVIIGAEGADTSQDESSVGHHAGMTLYDPRAEQQRKPPSDLSFLLSTYEEAMSDYLQLLQIRQSAFEVDLVANSDSHTNDKELESKKFRLARKLKERKAKRDNRLPVAESIPGYVGDRDLEFCLSYITGCKVAVDSESSDKGKDGGRLKLKKKRKGNAGASSSR